MKPLLDNQQLQESWEVATMIAQVLDTISANFTPYSGIIDSAAARAGVVFLHELSDGIRLYEPKIADLVDDSARELKQIIGDEL